MPRRGQRRGSRRVATRRAPRRAATSGQEPLRAAPTASRLCGSRREPWGSWVQRDGPHTHTRARVALPPKRRLGPTLPWLSLALLQSRHRCASLLFSSLSTTHPTLTLAHLLAAMLHLVCSAVAPGAFDWPLVELDPRVVVCVCVAGPAGPERVFWCTVHVARVPTARPTHVQYQRCSLTPLRPPGCERTMRDVF